MRAVVRAWLICDGHPRGVVSWCRGAQLVAYQIVFTRPHSLMR
jgi:hypothetical protein